MRALITSIPHILLWLATVLAVMSQDVLSASPVEPAVAAITITYPRNGAIFPDEITQRHFDLNRQSALSIFSAQI
jgi:hypothetical protein